MPPAVHSQTAGRGRADQALAPARRVTASDLARARAQFDTVLSLAESALAEGDRHAAAALAQIAAASTFPSHIGLFASPRLEALLLGIGRRLSIGATRGERPQEGGQAAAGKPAVLHVLTYARPVGGDSRFVWRWIDQDRSSRHSVAVTAQDDVEFAVPEALIDAAEGSGGAVHVLAASADRPLERARQLRALCRDVDTVVLHLFPGDVIPVLALAAECEGVRVAFVHHSDHTFWVGASVTNLMAHCRTQPPGFLASRRALDPGRAALLPIPLTPPGRGRGLADAKRALGVPVDAIVLLTIATPFKFTSIGGIGFLDLVVPVLQRMPQAVLLAVGPKPQGAWQAAIERTQGRILALGTRWDTDAIYDAADIYLDPFPFSSSTSLLEAGSRGIPLLAYCPPRPEAWLLGPGAPGFEDGLEQAGDVAAFETSLTRLIDEADHRERRGRIAREAILSKHSGAGWRDAVAGVHTALRQADGATCLRGDQDGFEAGPLDLAVAQLYASVQTGVADAIHGVIGPWPWRRRLPILWRLRRSGLSFFASDLAPRPAARFVAARLPWIGQAVSSLIGAMIRRRRTP